MYILGITTNHNSTAALLQNGEIVACVSEERFTRVKNQAGIPKNAIQYCLGYAKISPNQLEAIAVADLLSAPLPPKTHPEKPTLFANILSRVLWLQDALESHIPLLRPIFFRLMTLPTGLLRARSQRNRLEQLRRILPVPLEKFTFIDHHTCHVYSGLFSSPFLTQAQSTKRRSAAQNILVFTADGAGDLKSATVGLYKDGSYTKLQTIDSQQSIGFFYLHITQFLGLKPMEHEYKVMGLAPYAKDHKKIGSVYKKLSGFFEFDTKRAAWRIKVNEYLIQKKLPKLLAYTRFDHIAAATQKITEELLVKWIRANVIRHKVTTIVCSGGVFANVKVNQKMAQLPNVKEIFFMPSPGDESNAIGAAFYTYWQLGGSSAALPAAQPLTHLYLGPRYSAREIQKAITKDKNKAHYSAKRVKTINATVAKLLAKGEVVARFSGRMEFGARALGNRSILAHPKKREVVEVINRAIKKRDFWMPFAPTILREHAKDYLILHKADSPFMNVAYDTTEKARGELAAAIHPYDKTTRPQILDRETNPGYWDVIKRFESLTGIGAVLNTSFNLHGEPIVASPETALRVFVLSDLKHLALENWLLSKR
ncbi:hypothetical protein IH980_04510 [Patescibacteria group bacterium]|nr:hypothetical protein [Patescibacteria group bacterium]